MADGQMEQLIRQWVRPEIRALSAYHVPEAQGLIKLDAMENPYPLPEDLRRQWLQRLQQAELNRYPHPDAPGVKQALRQAFGVPEQAELLLGNGSDELIQMIAMTLAGPGRCIASVEPSFVMYRMIARFTGMEYHGVPLAEDDFSLDLDALLEAIQRLRPAVVFLAYPNNPTGNLFPEADLLRVIEAAPGLVVIDEAYAPFTDATLLDRVGRYPNLLVMRTLSKMGLAGLRLGLLAGPEPWIREIDKTRLPYNINVLTQVSVAFALEHRELFDRQTRAIRNDRDSLIRDLAQIPGLQVYPSQANFVLVRLLRGSAVELHAALREAGILVKSLNGSHPSLAECLRLTVGTPDENRVLLDALGTLL